MDFGFKPKPVIRFLRSRLGNAQKVASSGWGSFFAFIRTRTFALTFFICISMTAITFIMANTKIVQVVDGGSARYVYTLRTSKDSILQQCGITPKPGDQSDLSAFSNNFAKLAYYPAFTVTLTADHITRSIVMAKGTVADVLSRAGVTLSGNDEINEPVDLAVSSGTNIVVRRVNYKTVTQNTPISYPVVKSKTTLLRRDSEQVIVSGKSGVSQTTFRETFIDGVMTEKETVGRAVIAKPVACQMLVGTAASTPVSKLVPPSSFTLSGNGTPLRYARVIHGVATGYSPVDGAYCSTGRHTQVGYVAVDPNEIPYGTELYIMTPDGDVVYGYAVAYDTGGFTHNGSGITVDLFFNTYKEAGIFGRRDVDIYVLS